MRKFFFFFAASFIFASSIEGATKDHRAMPIISAKESVEHGLPKVEIEIDQGHSGFSVVKFPERETYLRLSGPPGGPLSVLVESSNQKLSDTSSLTRYLQSQIGKEAKFESASPLTISVGKKSYAAAFYVTGDGPPALTAHCAVLYPPPDERHASIIVTFGISATGISSCEEVLAAKPFEAIRRSLTITYR